MALHLISGTTSGIGAAYAALARARGAQVIAIIRNEMQRVAVPADDYVIFDYAQPETAAAAFAKIKTVDVFVNAAGVLYGRNFSDMTAEQYYDTLTVNLLTPMLLAQTLAPKLTARGIMIFLGSISGHKGSFDDAYAAAKGGIHSFVKSLALKLAPRGQRAIAIAPGITQDTRMTDVRPQSEKDTALKQIPLNRFARAEEIAEWIWFCASPAAASMTGAIIDINGGQYLR